MATGPATTTKAPRKVPKFDFNPNRPTMNRLQQSFYRKTFLPAFLAGNPVDVQGQDGYGGMLIHELIEERRSNPVEARRKLKSLLSVYSGENLPYFAGYVLADFYFLEGDFAAGHAALGESLNPAHYLTLSSHLGHLPVTAAQVLRWGEWAITSKGIGHLDAIMDVLQSKLDNFQTHHGLSLVEDFWNRAIAEGSVEEVAADIEDELLPRLMGPEVRAILAKARDDSMRREPLRAFSWWPGREEPISWPAPSVSWSFHFALLFARFRTLLREAENTARDQAEIPRVGEGLVSEVSLLRQLQAAFPEERVVHQARPGWLAPQSLDIYFSDHNIGVEYQGAQHSAPIDYFGGAKAFEVQQERDARKLGICHEYGCVLIRVHPGYKIESVVTQIRKAIHVRRMAQLAE